MGIFSSKPAAGVPAAAKGTIDTVIGADAVFEGNLHIKNSVCIEGTLRGKLLCEGRVILNAGGELVADVTAAFLSVNGKIVGNVKATEQLDVGETGVIEGDVEAAAITVAKGGALRGSCSMVEERPQEAVAPTRRAVPKAASLQPASTRKRAPGAAPEPVPS